MAFRVKDTEKVKIENPEQAKALAQRLKAMGATETERDDKASRMAKIKAKILGGELRPFDWSFAVVRGTGVQRRVNGQHSSEVIDKLTPEEWAQVVFPFYVVWTEYECDTEMDLIALFEQFDPGWSTRDRDDLVGVHLGVHKDLKVNSKLANKVLDGLVWYFYRVQDQKIGDDRRYHLIHESKVNRDFLSWANSFLTIKKTGELLSAPVMALIFHTMITRPDAAPVFWKAVAGGKSQLDPDSTEYKLAEYLENLADSSYEWPKSVTNRPKGKFLKKPSPFDTFSTCLRAFHASLISRKIVEIFAADNEKDAKEVAKKYPLAAKGTPDKKNPSAVASEIISPFAPAAQ